MTDSHLTRRALLRYGAYGAGAAALAGTAASWDRLTGADIPGRDDGSLVVATLGPAYGPAAVRTLTEGFQRLHPDIKVRINAVQAVDWSDFFAKILTQIAAGTAPDLVYVATEGVQLFARRLGVPLDRWVKRDAAELREYFADVHPALVESMMYEGSLYQLPVEFNAADIYLNNQVLDRAGAGFPAADWTRDDFTTLLRDMKRSSGSRFTPYFWTNRLWGGVVPWLFANDTNLLAESKAPGGSWLWDTFYPAAQRAGRGGGFRWTTPQAGQPRVEEAYDYLAALIEEGLCTRPEGGNGQNLIGVFSTGRVGVTPAGGFWAGGLHLAGMRAGSFDVQFFPRWRTQRMQFGAAGYALLRTSRRQDEAWEFIKYAARRDTLTRLFETNQTTPARRSMLNAARYAESGPAHWRVFYDTLDRFPDTAPIPAPPQVAEVEQVLLKHTGTALSSPRSVRPALRRMQGDLEQAMERDV
ncbi:sugar ABC transporter substrate-binding lipoprotein [Streptomyces spinoverrucosus]|uniref:Sugar ABC transporter substrate-binding lipoprotein n=1 Tax=Streptomyces spinoverrucosus TaxID=284043 RepID=A0A4Y3VMT5_9ACTN|nr:extracellular solute-binding protein [Streptomyces spinoverrucosus]GEC08234.1 sugar ABC transporter substrate-binding lipoprotein [Streptomyces spinoverrucosus]GHB94234.1 sugar ABC transporter substrate-binding lipoprotein [Streptomyces spinoverrucosus]